MPFDATSYLRLEAPHCIGSTASGASFATSTGDILEVSAFGPGVFRLRVGPKTRPDHGLIAGRTKACTFAQEDGVYRFGSGDATLELRPSPLRFRLLRNGALVAGSIDDESPDGTTRIPAFGRIRQGGQWTAAVALASGEPIYGLGEKYGSLDRRGQLLHSWVQDAQGVNTGLAHHETPFAWSPGDGKGAWGAFVHTPGAVIHGVGHPDWSHRTYAVVVDDEALDLFLFVADTPATILERYADVTGHAPEVPLWSLGLQLARKGYATPEDATRAIAQLRRRKIPCDAITLDAQATWTIERGFDFTWDPRRFGDAAAALRDIKRHDVRVTICESPYVSVHSPLFEAMASRGYLLRAPHGGPYVLGGARFGAGANAQSVRAQPPDCGLVDFANPAAAAWWRDAHADLFAVGVDAVQTDGGEHVPDDALAHGGERGVRLHNVYPLLYNRCVYEAAARFRAPQDGPPLVFARAGWTASQRATVPAGRAAQNDWEGLAASIRGALSLGMSGMPLHAIAAPGTYGSRAPDAELCLRWLQVASFASHCVVRGPAEWEPWALGEQAEAIARKWLAFRYRLLPYLERVVLQASRSGMPVLRAMPLAFPGNALVQRYETQFLCGDALLVAPIVQPGGDVEIALPPGGWFDLNSRQRLPGNRVVRYRATPDQFPVFGREGYALPLGQAVPHTGDIDAARPLAQLWLFGRPVPAQTLDGFVQAAIVHDGTHARITVAEDVKVERFGDADACQVTVSS